MAASLDSLVSVSAAAFPVPSIPRKARLSHAIAVPTGLEAVVPIPAGAVSAIVYQTTDGARTFPALVNIESGGAVVLEGGNGLQIIPATRVTRFECLSGQASHITTGAAPGQPRSYTIVYRLEY